MSEIRFIAEAPGRVNLIGEHTDYNGGFVLPTALLQRTRVMMRLREDDQVKVSSGNFQTESGSYRLGAEKRGGAWFDYIQGVTWVLRERGFRIRGFKAEITSEVPVGSGLSSSAALEIALMRALKAAFDLSLSDVEMAKLAQRVENEFVGARVGIMDQMAASLAEPGTALFLDTRDLTYQQIPLPLDAMDLVVINSGISHRNVGGGYNTRREECEKACAQLGVKQLRELGIDDLTRLDLLPDVLKRRARHVVTENARVLAAVDALHTEDLGALGKLFQQSHCSMRDDFEVSIPEIDCLVEIAAADANIFGARLTGGGFGGSIVALARKGRGAEAAQRIAEIYRRQTKQTPHILVPDLRAATKSD